ncbi:phosphonate metabolism protein/1,5-bisphosphokinase (PRPP-forming) PhnN [Pelagibacterium limicola]|uniref:phosphonate metabolism protein/1,5-bisphosphokinase (PRPP-forming) PhnN n=1 Tax=Pelagibacterium limicola TaxID=2791022 RepID=UPI0018B00CF4|nr:phosphonate metabolism protein/1,5-bisphosphokinase (PRPP-forming) PhnN [Pelagibacterium limicola]
MSAEKIGPGSLVAVVGPSGSGKDTLLRKAMAHFANDPDVVFPQRAITRPAGDAHEDHLALNPLSFEHQRANGAFALDWQAHGLRYGIPAKVDEDIAQGCTIVVNLSRSVIAAARARYANVSAVAITIDAETMRKRLMARGRETQDDIENRIARMDFSPPEGFDHVIDNTGPLETAAACLYAIIEMQGQLARA